MLISVLRAMKYDSNEARNLLPTILQLEALQNDQSLISIFNTEITDVPLWMFLEWIPQILSQYNFNNSCFLDKLLLNMSVKYPAALVYPFRLSFEQFMSLQSHKSTVQIRDIVNEIQNNLKNNNTDLFINGISNLCLPNMKLKHHLKNLQKFLSNFKFDDLISNEDYIFELNKIDDLVFEKNDTKSSDFYKKIENNREKLKGLIQLNPNTDREKIKRSINEMLVQLELHTSNRTKDVPIKLSQLSQWMTNFKYVSNSDNNNLEIPGQYTGRVKPNIMSHVKIIRFATNVQIFESLRKPVKLKIFGDNGKCYNFLVKYGEDLRQDQRIQKLFSIMTSQLELNPNCRRHNLCVQTYKVIPINNVCGITSWLENTMTLKMFAEESVKRRFRDEESVIIKAIHKYDAYSNGIMEKPRELVNIYTIFFIIL